MISLLIAGGVYVAATPQTTDWPVIDNHTLRGEAVPSTQVVCRNMWGTPMLPDGKGGYSLIAPINPTWIADSLIIPPKVTRGMVAYRPLPVVEETVVLPPTEPAPAPASTSAPAASTNLAPAAEAPVTESAPADPFNPAPSAN